MKGTLTEQYGLIKNGKGHKDVFLKEAKKLFPNFIRQGATFNEASTILKQKNIINENFVGVGAINNPFEKKKKEGYETAFDNFLKEAKKKTKKSSSVKATETKVSKMVQNSQSHAYNEGDKKEPNNMIFGQIQMGYYCELKEPKNEGKTDQELLDIVYKNLAKDSIYYTKNGQFGEAGVGYTNDVPGLGEPKEPKGPHKSSGYGKLKENSLLNEHSISMAGGIVTGGGFVGMNYMDYFGLNEESVEDIDAKTTATDKLIDKTKELKKELTSENIRPEVFQRLDGLMPLPALQTLIDEISTAYNSIEDARDAVQTIFADEEIREFDASDIVEYFVIQSQNALGRDSDLNLIKRLIGHSTS